MKIGYIRVSTEGQNTARQEVLMRELNVDKVFIDCASGKSTERSQLKEMLQFIREGDTVICESISRFARNTRDLLELIEYLKEHRVEFISKKESIDTTTPTGQFMLTVFGAVYALERENILNRQREGIEIAKSRGKYKGRKKIESPEFDKIYQLWASKQISAVKAMEQLDMKPNTFYRRVKELQYQ